MTDIMDKAKELLNLKDIKALIDAGFPFYNYNKDMVLKWIKLQCYRSTSGMYEPLFAIASPLIDKFVDPVCPKTGEFYGYKLVRMTTARSSNFLFFSGVINSDGAEIQILKNTPIISNAVIKLQIPEDAQRVSGVTRKCRCDKAIVECITDILGQTSDKKYGAINITEKQCILYILNSYFNPYFKYEVGKEVRPNSFDSVRWRECSYGIHFFVNKKDLAEYFNIPFDILSDEGEIKDG